MTPGIVAIIEQQMRYKEITLENDRDLRDYIQGRLSESEYRQREEARTSYLLGY